MLLWGDLLFIIVFLAALILIILAAISAAFSSVCFVCAGDGDADCSCDCDPQLPSTETFANIDFCRFLDGFGGGCCGGNTDFSGGNTDIYFD